ncbi:MAG: hypothetical protein AAF787_18790, partial [Chloroflexota bacterium]
NSLTRLFARAGLEFLAQFREQGTTEPQLDRMMHFKDLNNMLGIEDFRALERAYLPPKEEEVVS